MGIGMVPDMISAPIMAVEAGIESVISSDHPENVGGPYWNLLSVEVTREDGSQSRIVGAVFGSSPHIVQVDEYVDLFAFKPEGNHILTFRNEDKPGAILDVLDILHGANINVANVNVARASTTPGSGTSATPALCFMALDDSVSTNTLKSLKSLPHLHNVQLIQLY